MKIELITAEYDTMIFRSFGKMKMFVLLSCMLLALTVTACGADVPELTKKAPVDPLDKLSESFFKMGRIKSFRAKTTTYDAIETIKTEFQAPDRFHFVSNATSYSERYTIEGTDYYKVAPDQWRKKEAPGVRKDAVVGAVDITELKAGLDAAATKKFIGTEVLDGTPTLVFEYTVKEQTVISTYKVWVSASDSLVRKLNIATNATDFGHPGYGSNTNYYDYNQDILVEAPIK